jgi:stage V sporulation protein D (sporulation-specific penicillin-binding protein)
MFVLVVRLYIVQIVHGVEYRESGESQYVHTVQDLFKRGSIYFTTKDNEKVSAATIRAGYLLAIDPSRIVDVSRTYDALSAIIPIDREIFFERAGKKDKTYQEIEREVGEEESTRIEELKLPGVKLYKNQWRYYPGKSLAARTIGFIGYDENTLVGKYGLERYYDDKLARDNEHLSVNFFAEIFSNLGSLLFDSKNDREANLVTTIEPTVARALDRVLEDAQKTWNSRITGASLLTRKQEKLLRSISFLRSI